MSHGIRRTCGKCYSTDYNSKLQVCRKCGWTPYKKGFDLMRLKKEGNKG